MSAILQWVYQWSGASIYSAKQICLVNDPVIISFSVGADVTIAACCALLGIFFIRERNKAIVNQQLLFLWLAVAIFLGGAVHLLNAITIFLGVYRLQVVALLAMASCSILVTTIAISNKTPRLSLPSQED